MLAAAAHDTDRDKVMMAKYAIPEMVKNDGLQCRGSIVNLASVAGLRGGNPHLLYPTSKGAIVVSVDLDYTITRSQYADPDLFSEHDASNGQPSRTRRHTCKLCLPWHGVSEEGAGRIKPCPPSDTCVILLR